MYETHFGFSGPPFQLSPDPAFYFDSRGHSSALAYLKFGAHQGEGFIVVTGEIGAGKTTLVRTLLESLDPARTVAAQIVSTQLEAGDLLRTILTAYGVPASGTSKAGLLATLEAFLTAVAAKGRRALLIVDEAQNLDRGAVEELRMLSNFQLGNQGLLQSFLVGQPELRVLLQSKSMEQLRQRVIASCHLGPLDRGETRAYIEHRLRRVGWSGRPAFEDAAHDRIHHWTGGIPRRINRLCTRLLLGAFLADQGTVSAGSVDRMALDLGSEIGEAIVPEALAAADRPEAAPRLAAQPAAWGVEAELPVEVRSRGPSKPLEPVICLVDSRSDHLKAGALSQVFADHPALPPVIAVHMGAAAELALDAPAAAVLGLPARDIHLNLGPTRGAASAALALTRFDRILDDYGPAAVIAIGSSDAVLACALLAHKRRFSVLRTHAGRRRAWTPAAEDTNAILIDQIADVLYTDTLATHYALYRVGIASDRVHCVGDLAGNVARQARTLAPEPAALKARLRKLDSRLAGSAGFALATQQFQPQRTPAGQVHETAALLALARAEIAVLWLVDAGTQVELRATGVEAQLKSAGIAVAADLGYLDAIALLTQARCVIAGREGLFVDEAHAVGTPSLVIDGGTVILARGSESAASSVAQTTQQLRRIVHDLVHDEDARGEVPEYWDGGAGGRIATHLGLWLRKQRRSRDRLKAAEPAVVARRTG